MCDKKHKVEWRLYSRLNLGKAACTSPTEQYMPNPRRTRMREDGALALKLVNSYQRKDHAELWMSSDKPDRKMVYVLQQWVDGQPVHHIHRALVCDCGVHLEAKRTFDIKWAWDARRGWHKTNFMHRSEGTYSYSSS